MTQNVRTTNDTNFFALLGTNEVEVVDDVVRHDERMAITAWIADQHRAGKLVRNPKDHGAFSTPFRASDGALTRFIDPKQRATAANQKVVWVPEVEAEPEPLPLELWNVRARIIERLGLSALADDPYKGAFISYIQPGTGVHTHRDERLTVGGKEWLILRCNVLIQRPEAGGLPMFDGRLELDVPECSMWAFYPTELVHSAGLVQGDTFRALFSFGLLVALHDLWQRRFHLHPDFISEFRLDGGAKLACSGLIKELGANAPDLERLGQLRLGVLTYALDMQGDFSVLELATVLASVPEQVWPVLRDFQRKGILRSTSSIGQGGKVWIL